TRGIGSAPGLGEELGPDLLTAQHPRDVTLLLLLGAELEQQRHARDERRRLDLEREVVATQLAVERVLVLGREPLAAVLLRDDDPRVAAVEQDALQLTTAVDAGEVVGIGARRLVGEEEVAGAGAAGRHVRGDPRARTRRELLDRDQVVAHAAAPCSSATM